MYERSILTPIEIWTSAKAGASIFLSPKQRLCKHRCDAEDEKGMAFMPCPQSEDAGAGRCPTFKWSRYILLLCLLSSLGYADDPRSSLRLIPAQIAVTPQEEDTEALEPQIAALETRMSAIKNNSIKDTTGAKLAPAAPQLDGLGLFAFGDLLYWQFREWDTDYVIANKSPAGTLPIEGTAKHIDFNWDFGFRVGAGYHLEHDSWDALFNFTCFQTDAIRSQHVHQNGSLIPEVSLPLTINATHVKTHWDLYFYVLDLELGRNFFISKYLAFRPCLSVEGAWIIQHNRAKIEFLSPTPPTHQRLISKTKNDFLGVGPRVGIDSTWYWSSHFNLFGTFSGALLWGFFDISQRDLLKRESLPNATQDHVNADFHTIVPNVKAALGLGWNMTFGKDISRLSVRLGYEFQYWWRQNQSVRNFETPVISFERVSGDFTLDGVTLDLRYDF